MVSLLSVEVNSNLHERRFQAGNCMTVAEPEHDAETHQHLGSESTAQLRCLAVIEGFAEREELPLKHFRCPFTISPVLSMDRDERLA